MDFHSFYLLIYREVQVWTINPINLETTVLCVLEYKIIMTLNILQKQLEENWEGEGKRRRDRKDSP